MKVSEQIIEVLNYLGEKFGIAIDWTSDNVLPYVEELCGKFIKWEISTSIAWIVIAAIVAILAGIVAKFVDLEGFEWGVFGAITIIALLVIGAQIFDIIECHTFPEKTIYEYITNMITQYD